MKKINFTKMVASGNDFVVIETGGPTALTTSRLGRDLVKKICDRKYGIGTDGVLLLEKSKIADVRMRIFNADGSEAEMCGNGARCAALYISHQVPRLPPPKSAGQASHRKINIETKAGIIDSEVKGDIIKIKLTEPKDIKLDIPVKINNRSVKVNFINTGVPHAVIFAQGLDEIDILLLGRLVRYHDTFTPKGTNVDFVEELDRDSVKVRTYERGVEDETLACGTGSVASALIFALKNEVTNKISVYTRSKDVLNVYFTKTEDKFDNVWLEGKAEKVYEGAYYV